MEDQRFPLSQRQEALARLLEAPHALVAALGVDGFRVSLPETVPVSPDQVIPLPADRATLIDFVVPSEAMAVVHAWEQVLETGLSLTDVHARYDPQRLLTLRFLDMRESYGVLLAGFTPAHDRREDKAAAAIAHAFATSQRPRTASLVKSEFAVILDLDERATRMLGWTRARIAGKRSTEVMHPEDHERAVSSWLDMLATKEPTRVRTRLRCADGSWLWVETEHTYLPATDADPEPRVIAQLTDISDEMKAHEELGQREALFRRLAESLPVGILQLTENSSLVYANSWLSAAAELSSASSLDEFRGRLDATSLLIFDKALAAALHEGREEEAELTLLTVAGEKRTLSVRLISLGPDEGAPGALCCFVDVTEAARLREELRVKATFDMLTSCHNRASVMGALTELLDDAARNDSMVTTVFIDLDDFKPVNDEFGHEAGDRLLALAGRRAADVIPASAIIGRLGGDEFLVVTTEPTSSAEAHDLADRISAALGQPTEIGSVAITPSASVGVACSRPNDTATSLVSRADRAMYAQKAEKKGLGPPSASAALPVPREAFSQQAHMRP